MAPVHQNIEDSFVHKGRDRAVGDGEKEPQGEDDDIGGHGESEVDHEEQYARSSVAGGYLVGGRQQTFQAA